VGGKYPLSQAADDAKRAEEQAKALRWRANGVEHRKDAIGFLSAALPWSLFGMEEEAQTPNLRTVHGLMHELTGLVEAGAPKALLRRLVDFYGEYIDAQRRWQLTQGRSAWVHDAQTVWGRWMWRSVYTMKRMAERNRSLETRLERLRTALQQDDYRLFERLGVAARWAELITRREER
jgi:hypothetical protein